MNAPIRPRNLMELLRQHGCTLLDGKSGGLKEAGSGGARRGLDDDQSRHDEPGALRFMELVRNDAKRFPTRDSILILPAIIALWTALGPNREDHYDRLLDWWLEYGGDNDDDGLRKILDSIEGGSSLGIDYLRARCPELALEYAQEVFADDPPPEYVDDAPPVSPFVAQPDAFSHDAIALQFADLHAEEVRFAAQMGKWFEWSVSGCMNPSLDGGRLMVETTEAVGGLRFFVESFF